MTKKMIKEMWKSCKKSSVLFNRLDEAGIEMEDILLATDNLHDLILEYFEVEDDDEMTYFNKFYEEYCMDKISVDELYEFWSKYKLDIELKNHKSNSTYCVESITDTSGLKTEKPIRTLSVKLNIDTSEATKKIDELKEKLLDKNMFRALMEEYNKDEANTISQRLEKILEEGCTRI